MHLLQTWPDIPLSQLKLLLEEVPVSDLSTSLFGGSLVLEGISCMHFLCILGHFILQGIAWGRQQSTS